MKKRVFLFSILLLGFVFALGAMSNSFSFGSHAFAQGGHVQGAPPSGPHKGPGYGPPQGIQGPPAWTTEQQAAFDKLSTAHRDKIKPLKQDLIDQRLIYRALVGNQNASTDDIRQVVAQMRKLQDAIDAQRDSYWQELDKAGLGLAGHKGYFTHDNFGGNCPGYYSDRGGHRMDRGDGYGKHGRYNRDFDRDDDYYDYDSGFGRGRHRR
ncbi:MAG: periplasmic heavy metal sensor [Deltaproteobacteria bacterium]|jgi:Spy/CpxP family protein refolding chaperone|nr:periplasmic heavy metal sensor [Deltaproteobacteria bacterium]